ncbi:MAG: hypothetical protein HYV96_16840 [Opitutae bacterium]|nr:hypothetical protein [Opitutae bacterium]
MIEPLAVFGRLARTSGSLVALALISFAFSGCATTQVSYKTLNDAPQRIAALKPQIAPLHVDVFELSAGGVSEKRDDWSQQVTTHIAPILAEETGYRAAPILTPEQKTAIDGEMAEVVGMLQIITLNHLTNLMGPAELQPQGKPLTYNVGRIDKLLDSLGADSLLVTFVRDEYSTGGRKALMALGVLVSGVTGVYIVPRGGVTVNAAALVERDGTVVWFNYAGSGGDMRTPEGARATAKLLLAGLPGDKGGAKSTTAVR